MATLSPESRATTAGKWLLAVVTPLSALLLGSIPVDALIVMSALAAVSCGLLWVEAEPRVWKASRWILLALGLLLCFTAFQAIPLPSSFAHAIAPTTADIWERALSPLHEPGPALHPLSVAPGATRVELLRGCFYGCMFLAALRVASLREGERFLVRLVIASTSIMAIGALAHTALNAEKVFGIYQPREIAAYQPGHRAPLLNTNHLAAYLGMGACVSLGALLSGRAVPRALSASTTLVLAATCVSQGSRGAVGALVFGSVLTLALTRYARRHFDSARAGGLVLAACAVAAAVIVSVSVSGLSGHILSHDLSKVEVAQKSFALVGSSPWFGFGRGAFESVFWSVREGTDYMTWTNPEDLVVQWFVEWGIPVSVVAFGLLGWTLRPQVLLRAVRPAIGPWVAIVAAVLHDLVDFHFEVPGIVALGIVCGAIVLGARPKSPTSASQQPTLLARVPAAVLVLGTMVAISWVHADGTHLLADDRRALSAEALDSKVSPEQFRADVRAAMLRYPSESFFPLTGAIRAQFTDSDDVMPWVGRALERNPRFARAHFVLARALAARHPAQARLEYRLAYEYEANLRGAVVKQVLPLIDDPDSALELVPQGEDGATMMDALAEALAPRLPATSVILDEELTRRSPSDLAPLRRRARAATADAIDEAPWCVPVTNCLPEALAAARELAQREPDRCEGHVLVAKLLVKKREAVKAFDGLEHAADEVSDRAACQRELINLALEAGERRRPELALERLVRGGCGSNAECIDLYSWAAGMEEQRGQYVLAVRLYQRLADLQTDSDATLQHIGSLGDRDGVRVDAMKAYEVLASRHPGDPQWATQLAALRGRAHPAAPVLPATPDPSPTP